MIEPLRIVRTTEQATAIIPIAVPLGEIRKVMGPSLQELRAAVAEQNIAVSGPWFTHHLRPPSDTWDFEICLPVASPVQPSGRMKLSSWPAMTVAQTTYHGGFEGLGAAWGQFLADVAETGHKMRPDLWERYVIGPETTADPAAWRTELNKPLAED